MQKKDETDPEPSPTASTGTINFRINNQKWMDKLYNLDRKIYTNAAGNVYQVDLLKYYLSHFTLIKSDGTEYNLNNHELINAEVDTTCQFSGSKCS